MFAAGAMFRAALLSWVPSAALASTTSSTVYVDNQSADCSPAGPGTEASPYCSISSAMSSWKGPGVTIVVKPGIYREQVQVGGLAAGTAGSPFVLRAQGPGAVIDGADDFANPALWMPAPGTAYRAASVTWTPKQVWVDGVRLSPTTFPPGAMPANSFEWVTGEGLYVNLGGANPGTRPTLVGRRNHCFNLFSTAFVTVEGFAVTRAEDHGIQMQSPCSDVTIAGNIVSFANSYGIQTVGGQRIVIDGNAVSDCGNHGIGLTAGASDCVVSDNESFRNAFPAVRQANGIYLSTAPSNVIRGNRLHHNQDSGLQLSAGSRDCVLTNNRSWANGDHGYDQLGSGNTIHLNNVAYGNFRDGFSFEGDSPGAKLYNSIAVDNGLTTNEYDLWVDGSSAAGFTSDHNLFWNSTSQPPIKFIAAVHATLEAYQLASRLDAHSLQSDPLFTGAAAGDFTLRRGSPAIDAAHSGVSLWPELDVLGQARIDDPRTANRGEGPVLFADLGGFEFVPTDAPPVLSGPGSITASNDETITFQVTASDPDGDPIASLDVVQMPVPSGATFTPNATCTAGTFTWAAITPVGDYAVSFIARNSLADTLLTSIHVSPGVTGVGLPFTSREPAALALPAGFPNPSADRVELVLELSADARVEMAVFDLQGRCVWDEERDFAAGRTSWSWSGMTAAHRRAAAGIYLVRARAGGRMALRRIARW